MNNRYFYFNKEHLKKLAEKSSEQYRSATPFPHAVFDDFFPAEVLREVLAEFPGTGDIEWNRYGDENQDRKLSCEDETQMGPKTRHLLSQCNSSTLVSFLEELTGISGLIPDPHFRGGGLHQTLRGGMLGVHADFNTYKRLGLYRRLNILIYLNEEWDEAWGGHLELWSRDGKECRKKVAPHFNRVALFSTAEDSYHGHPHPLQTPEGVSRKSLALYYYTAERPESISAKAHTTLFLGDKRRKTMREVLRSCIPPIVLDGIHTMRGR